MADQENRPDGAEECVWQVRRIERWYDGREAAGVQVAENDLGAERALEVLAAEESLALAVDTKSGTVADCSNDSRANITFFSISSSPLISFTDSSSRVLVM